MVVMAALLTFLPVTVAAQEPIEHGTKQADGLEITLLSRPPLSPAEMQQPTPGMGGMGGMQGMGGMMRGMQGMEGVRGMPGTGSMGGGAAQPTHWIGVVVRDLRDDRVLQNLQVALSARKGGVTRTVQLMPMPGSYGAHISLPEKGRYNVLVGISRPGRPLNVAFELNYE
jgi:hypothetical protein